MNERIKELAEQAGIDFFNSTDPEYSGREYCEAWTEQQQKFAELIVQECLYIVEGEDDCGPDTKSVRLAMERMKQHFGVEE